MWDLDTIKRMNAGEQHFALDVMALTSGDAEYGKRMTVLASDLDQAIDIALGIDGSIYHIRLNGRPVWAAYGIDL